MVSNLCTGGERNKEPCAPGRGGDTYMAMSCCVCDPTGAAQSLGDDTHAVVKRVTGHERGRHRVGPIDRCSNTYAGTCERETRLFCEHKRQAYENNNALELKVRHSKLHSTATFVRIDHRIKKWNLSFEALKQRGGWTSDRVLLFATSTWPCVLGAAGRRQSCTRWRTLGLSCRYLSGAPRQTGSVAVTCPFTKWGITMRGNASRPQPTGPTSLRRLMQNLPIVWLFMKLGKGPEVGDVPLEIHAMEPADLFSAEPECTVTEDVQDPDEQAMLHS